jgi:hypothetical protein
MALSDLAAVGNFLSGIAVVFSFAFLALQMRQANLNQKSLMQQGRSGRTIDVLMRLADPILSTTAVRAFKGDPTMSEAEHFAFYGFAASIFWSYEDSFLQFQSGTLDAESWSSDVSTLKNLLASPAYRAVWRAARESIGEGYRQFVDGIAQDMKNSPIRDTTAVLRQYFAEEFAAALPTVTRPSL